MVILLSTIMLFYFSGRIFEHMFTKAFVFYMLHCILLIDIKEFHKREKSFHKGTHSVVTKHLHFKKISRISKHLQSCIQYFGIFMPPLLSSHKGILSENSIPNT